MQEESYIQQLAKYIKKNLAKGYTLDSLRTALEQQDYSRSAIERAIKLADEQLAATLPEMMEKPKITYKVVKDADKADAGTEQIQEKPKKKSFLKKLFK